MSKRGIKDADDDEFQLLKQWLKVNCEDVKGVPGSYSNGQERKKVTITFNHLNSVLK